MQIAQAMTEASGPRNLKLLAKEPQHLESIEALAAATGISFGKILSLFLTYGPIVFSILKDLSGGITMEKIQALIAQYGEQVWAIISSLFKGVTPTTQPDTNGGGTFTPS